MTSLDEKKRRRRTFMQRLYDATGGDTRPMVGSRELGAELGWSAEQTDAVTGYLEDEGLLRFPAGLSTDVSITHAGRVEVEVAAEHPERPTEHFPAVSIVVQGDVVNSALQAGTVGSSRSVAFADQRRAVEDFVAEFRHQLERLPLDDEARAVARADLATVEAQLASPRTNEVVVREGVRSLRNVAEGVVASGAFAALADLAGRVNL